MIFDKHIAFIIANRYTCKRDCFGFSDEELRTYLRWSAYFGYLLEVWDGLKLTGIAIAYPVKNNTPTEEDLCKFSEVVDFRQEALHTLCIMDWMATSDQARKRLVTEFKMRFPNWEYQKKIGMQNGKLKELPNKYINLLNTI